MSLSLYIYIYIYTLYIYIYISTCLVIQHAVLCYATPRLVMSRRATSVAPPT